MVNFHNYDILPALALEHRRHGFLSAGFEIGAYFLPGFGQTRNLDGLGLHLVQWAASLYKAEVLYWHFSFVCQNKC